MQKKNGNSSKVEAIVNDFYNSKKEFEILTEYQISYNEKMYMLIIKYMLDIFKDKKISLENASEEFVEFSKKIVSIQCFHSFMLNLIDSPDANKTMLLGKQLKKYSKCKQIRELFMLIIKINNLEEKKRKSFKANRSNDEGTLKKLALLRMA